MQDFAGRIAVITGGGSGMGRALARALAIEGCRVAVCDLDGAGLSETARLCGADAPGVRVTTHVADVASEADLAHVRDEVMSQHATDHIHLLFNNAGIGGGGSFVADSREAWDRTFNIDWGGVYFGVRTFLPLLIAAEAGHIVNTSSVCGFWASSGPDRPNTAYAAAKFAVKGFTEALVTDLRLNAPHIGCSVVMPGHVGTSIVVNSHKIRAAGDVLGASTGDDMATSLAEFGRRFERDAATSAAQAAAIILDGVRKDRWRILVGQDAEELDRRIRSDPEAAYEADFYARYSEAVGASRSESRP
jgi:NAD(P)-dependent dehydrogenase (short-subunit alcohol dehydrogenase family)